MKQNERHAVLTNKGDKNNKKNNSIKLLKI